jgi:hypothetical protein
MAQTQVHSVGVIRIHIHGAMGQDDMKDKLPFIGKTLLVSAFPATGKSWYVDKGEGSGYMPEGFATDSDSSKFDKSGFPQNYIRHINEKISQGYARVFISSHKEVRDALVLNGLPFVLIYPKKELKSEYIERYRQRGSGDKFIQLVSDNWDAWIEECESQNGCHHIQLESGQFVSNVV